MEYSFLFAIIFLVPTIHGNVEISFVKGATRLNNSMHCDYYFACHAEGGNLQWRVNDNNISDYSGESIIGSVLNGLISDCNYITTLLTLTSLSSEMSLFDSILIISCQNSTSFNVVCSNGSESSVARSPEKSRNIMAENNIASVYLEHLLNRNLVNANNAGCANIFVCGVDNGFMTWKEQGIELFTFTTHDPVGRKRQRIRGATMVEQQAILLDKVPYSLVVVLIVIDSGFINVTCGYDQNTTILSSMACLTNLSTTEFQITDKTEPETVGTMESERSTVGRSTNTPGGNNNGVVIIVTVVVTIICCCICSGIFNCIVLCCLNCNCNRIRKRRPMRNVELHRIEQDGPSLHEILEVEVEYKEENKEPYIQNENESIKMPKQIQMDDSISRFCKEVKYIIYTTNHNEFNAATTYIMRPEIEGVDHSVISRINDKICIGNIGSHKVGIIKETIESCKDTITTAIIEYFCNANFVLGVGGIHAINDSKYKLADVLISKIIVHASGNTDNTEEYYLKSAKMKPAINKIFCQNSRKVNGLKVTAAGRMANHYCGKITSGTNLLSNSHMKRLAKVHKTTIGHENAGGELIQLQKDGINVPGGEKKSVEVICICGVTGYVDGKKYKNWQFMASQAAFHYVAAVMNLDNEPDE